jgi:hypothetical protein
VVGPRPTRLTGRAPAEPGRRPGRRAAAVGHLDDGDGYITTLHHPACRFHGFPEAFEGITILRFDGDLVVERWNRLDDVTLLQQLGVLEAPAAA